MWKWAKKQMHAITVGAEPRVDAIALTRDAEPSSMISTAAQRVTRRLVALSSSGFDSPSAGEIINALERTTSPRILRRPGVDARWKEANRVPFHHQP